MISVQFYMLWVAQIFPADFIPIQMEEKWNPMFPYFSTSLLLPSLG